MQWFDSNSDTDFESKFKLYRKLVEFNWKWLKITRFHHFHRHFDIICHFWLNNWHLDGFFNLLIKNWSKVNDFNRKMIEFRSKLWSSTRICRWISIRPKSTIEIGFQIWFNHDDLICNPLIALAYWKQAVAVFLWVKGLTIIAWTNSVISWKQSLTGNKL